MNKSYLFKSFIICILTITSTFKMFSQAQQWIVQFSDSDALERTLNNHNDLKQYHWQLISPTWNIFTISSNNNIDSLQFRLNQLKNEKKSNILNFLPDQKIQWRNTDSIPNDPNYPLQWNLNKLEIEEVWKNSTGGTTKSQTPIVIAVIDSGFDISHPEFENQIWINPNEEQNGVDDDNNGLVDDIHGWNYRENSPSYTVSNGHGTSVLGILAAKSNNNLGISGTSWKTSTILFEIDTLSDVIQSYEYIYQQRKKWNETQGEEGTFIVAINASFGFDGSCTEDHPWNQMMTQLGLIGIVSCAATLNSNVNIDQVGDIPTSCSSDFLISITNSTSLDKLASGTAFGPLSIDIAAPSGEPPVATYTTNFNNQYVTNFNGTSGATPHVTGTIALIYSLICEDQINLAYQDPVKMATLIKRSILESAEPVADLNNKTVTEGRLNAFRSMLWWQIYCEDPTDEPIDIVPYLNSNNESHFIKPLHPNPADQYINLEYQLTNTGTFKANVYDILGHKVHTSIQVASPFGIDEITIDCSQWPNGTYYVVIDNGNSPLVATIIVLHSQ